MKLNEKRISQIQTVLIKDDDGIEFAVEFGEGSWYICNKSVSQYGPEEKDGSPEIVQTFSGSWADRPYSELYEVLKGKDLKARVFLGWEAGKEQYNVFYDWEKLAKGLGISDLVTLATKVPKVVAKRFTIFANQKGDRSSVLRDLIYKYVKDQMVEQAEELMFKENI